MPYPTSNLCFIIMTPERNHSTMPASQKLRGICLT